MKRPDGRFTFAIEKLIYQYDHELRERLHDYEMIWIVTDPVGGIYGTPEAARREASGSETWLEEL
jgi:hypothetical protein